MSGHQVVRLLMCGALALAHTGCASLIIKSGIVRSQGDKALTFIAANPARAALFAMRGDTVLASWQADRAQPLASTAKVMIALTYAEDVAAGQIDSTERVSLHTLERFYLPGYDGGAHEQWVSDLRRERRNARLPARDTVPIGDVVRGMIRFSSNANAEWLLARLGVDRVNASATRHGIRHDVPLYFAFSSALLILRDTASVSTLRQLTTPAWIARAAAIHDSLAADSTGQLRRSLDASHAALVRQRVWSDRLPSSSAGDYARFADRVAARRTFDSATQRVLDDALNARARAAAVETIGFKGGSTVSVFTDMTYILMKDGSRTAYAVFFRDLTERESQQLQTQISFWNLLLATDPAFRAHVAALGRKRQP
jgi:D-alanyl-D-alanine carboxypeptidase